MARERRAYSPAEELSLTTQVGGVCPLCGAPLFYSKKVGKPPRTHQFKAYELAHIYPLNPTPQEVAELVGVTMLNDDVNDPANLIPLCLGCHGRFDKPRTRLEYEQLVALKREALAADQQKLLRREFPIEDEIHRIVTRLHEHDVVAADMTELAYDPRSLADKFDETLPRPTRHKIRAAVAGYYAFIKAEFAELERRSPTASTLIFSQVRSFYLKQKSLGLSQGHIFANVVDWIDSRTRPSTPGAAELIGAFFVQNCEVLD